MPTLRALKSLLVPHAAPVTVGELFWLPDLLSAQNSVAHGDAVLVEDEPSLLPSSYQPTPEPAADLAPAANAPSVPTHVEAKPKRGRPKAK
ncbi:MAG: hypothetical protein ABIT01_19550 [Thermoanaerobaculia bacterium]